MGNAFHAIPAIHTDQAVNTIPAVTEARLIKEDNIPAKYDFGYSISDSVSGDSKSRQESRDGDVVHGSYSVADPDGRIRTVTYTADAEHGFQAKVTYDGEEGPPAIPFNQVPTVTAVRTVPDVHVVSSAPVVQAVHSTPSIEVVDNNEATIVEARASQGEDKNLDSSARTTSVSDAVPVTQIVPNLRNIPAI